ncbi:TPA: hypothetical protein ACIFE8_002181 [Yersinia enterocolitica]
MIHRPTLWQWLPGATQGHACNVIKFKDSNLVHFFDTQKKTHLSCDLTRLSEKSSERRKFLGSVGADGIDLYKKEFHENFNKKAGASSAPA